MLSWYALYTKPRMENQVNAMLEHRGIPTYLPLIHLRRRGATTQRVAQPFFPCYLFAQIDFEIVSASSVSWMQGLRRVVSFCGEPVAVDEDIITAVRDRLGTMESRRHGGDVRFRPGDRVRIRDGILKDMEAIFDESLSASGRVRILLNILSRQTACEIEAEDLEKLPG